MAEVSGYTTNLPPRHRETLLYCVNNLFPGAIEPETTTFWTGLRPMTLDGTPIVGRTGLSNLYINSGHGTLGWTMACGSARIISDQISGASPEIEADDLGLSRY